MRNFRKIAGNGLMEEAGSPASSKEEEFLRKVESIHPLFMAR